MEYEKFLVKPGKKIRLEKDYDPAFKAEYLDRKAAAKKLKKDIERMEELQDTLYAMNQYSILIVLQARDAAGKDGTIKHVMSGVNPQGCSVVSFKTPSAEELDHDYLWRCNKALPERGRIGIFNRSYYEEVLVTRVHPDIIGHQQLPDGLKGKGIWKRRFEEINHFEKYLTDNGTVILKFFLNVSRGEQKNRFLERIDRPEKNWKFSPADLKERAYWDDYTQAYEDMFNHTSTACAPWHIIPADNKWFTRLVVADIICSTLESLNLTYPETTPERRQQLLEAKTLLDKED